MTFTTKKKKLIVFTPYDVDSKKSLFFQALLSLSTNGITQRNSITPFKVLSFLSQAFYWSSLNHIKLNHIDGKGKEQKGTLYKRLVVLALVYYLGTL